MRKTPIKIRGFLPAFSFIFAANLCLAGQDKDPAKTESGSGVWPEGKTCAVSLTYDDALPVHHNYVAPLLEQYGIRGTFYLTILNIESPEEWKAVASKGHELGNHSLFHPCRREEGYDTWLAEYYDLKQYTKGRFRDELYVANLFLDLLDGGKPRTYGNTCTNLTIGSGEEEVPMDSILEELFVASRGAITNKPVDPLHPAFSRLGHYSGDGKTFEQIRSEIEQARDSGGWIIYMIHGVGPETHNLYIDREEHEKLIQWLGQDSSSVWTAPVADIAEYLKESYYQK